MRRWRLWNGTLRAKGEGKGAGRGGRKSEEGQYNSQPFERRLNVRKFEEDGSVRDALVVEHEANTPDDRREADVLGAG